MSIEVKMCLSEKCQGCNKRVAKKMLPITNETPPYQIVFSMCNSYTVMLTEMSLNKEGSQVPCYVFYECEDYSCLLNLLREVVLMNWTMQEREREQKKYRDQLIQEKSQKKKSKSRRRNRKNNKRVK